MPTMPGTFRAPHAPTPAERQRATDAARGSARDRGYTTQWDRASIAFIAKHPLCPACLAAGITRATEVTDHTIPHKGDKGLFWSRANWQPSCRWHHDVVKQILERLFASGSIGSAELVLTSPFALEVAARERAP